MDFEKYIGKEKQLLTRLEKERASIDAYERRSNAGSLDMAEDEMKLLEYAASWSSEHIDRRRSDLKGAGRAFGPAKRDWKTSINNRNARDSDARRGMGKLLRRALQRTAEPCGSERSQALEIRNKELIVFIRAQEDIFAARSAELTNKTDRRSRLQAGQRLTLMRN